VLVVVAAYFLLRFAERRPLLAAILFGVFTGFAAYIRAIVVPLAALAALVFRAYGKPWRKSLAAAAVAGAVALLMLSPWAVRNRLRYGETFFTDSHGGLTALVGANPNTDGCYSRSLNRMFHDVTGFAPLAEPHRQTDRASLAIAQGWIEFDPLFTVGLLASKAERLFVHERALLYWPLFRAGVLPEPYRAFFGRHQGAIESVADAFWLATLALGLFGCGLAYARKQWLALSLLPQAALLAALYTAIFSEPRYRMPICMLLLPLSAMAIAWLFQTGRGLWRRTLPSSWQREVVIAGGLVVLVFALAPLLAWAGGRLREGHRWAVHECAIARQNRFCSWRTIAASGDLRGQPGVKGVWNGVGIAVPEAASGRAATLTAETELVLSPGDYALTAAIDLVPARRTGSGDGSITILANEELLALPIPLAEIPAAERGESPLVWRAALHHAGGPLRLRTRIDVPVGAQPGAPGRVWLSDLSLVPGNKP
jgi:hypothetical protein